MSLKANSVYDKACFSCSGSPPTDGLCSSLRFARRGIHKTRRRSKTCRWLLTGIFWVNHMRACSYVDKFNDDCSYSCLQMYSRIFTRICYVVWSKESDRLAARSNDFPFFYADEKNCQNSRFLHGFTNVTACIVFQDTNYLTIIAELFRGQGRWSWSFWSHSS